MAKRKTVIPLGKPFIFTTMNNDNLFYIRIKTKLSYIDSIQNILPKLIKLNFKIISIKRNSCKVYLPPLWCHFVNSLNEEYICDERGRIRIIIDKVNRQFIILKRFSYKIEVIESDSNEIQINRIQCFIMDCDKVLSTFIMQDSDLNIKFWEKTGMTKERMIEIVKEQCEKSLTEYFPDWRNELAYWEVD